MEKPVRRKGSKGSFLRSLEAASSTTHESSATKENEPPLSVVGHAQSKAKDSVAAAKVSTSARNSRTYHIPAATGVSATDARNSLIGSSAGHAIDGSESGDVDLNLSFDFVSKMEDNGNMSASSSSAADQDAPQAVSPSKPAKEQTPRGMSKADWGSRSRKKPPTPLSLGRQRGTLKGDNEKNAVDLTSHFSPDSPTKSARNPYDDEPLTLVPISATKRSADSSITPTSRDAMTSLINEQRTAAAQRTLRKRNSPIKRNAQGAIVVDGTSPKKGRVLGESKMKANVQVERRDEQSEVIVPDRWQEAALEDEKRDSFASLLTTAPASSTGHDSNAHQRLRGLRSRQPSAQESTDSNHSAPQSFKTSATSKSTNGHDNNSSLGGDHVYSLSPSAENVLGLLFTPKRNDVPVDIPVMPKLNVPTHDPSEQARSDTMSSPSTRQKSSPYTPVTPLFASDDDELHRGSISSAGARTPATAVSTLFGEGIDDRRAEGKTVKGEGSAMLRGTTAPIPAPSAIAADVIREESLLSIERPASVPPPQQVSLSQDDVSKELMPHRMSSGSSDHVSTESMDQSSVEEMGQQLVISTMSSPEKQKMSFDLTQVTGTGVKKGPWSESPLLLDGQGEDASPNSVGLGLFLPTTDGVKEAKVAKVKEADNLVGLSDVLVVHQSEMTAGEFGALGLNLQGYELIQGGSNKDDSEIVPPPSSKVEEQKSSKLRPLRTRTSGSDGFAINITPPAFMHDANLHQPDHRVDVPSSVVPVTVTADAGVVESNRWSSKLWSFTGAFRSPVRTSFADDEGKDSTTPPPLRTLTLVSKQSSGQGTVTEKHRRSRSRNDATQSTHPTSDTPQSGYHTVPTSSVLSSQAHFNVDEQFSNGHVARPQVAHYSEARSSRHVLRPTSGIRYVNQDGDGNHIRLDMDSPAGQVDSAWFDEIKSPRVAASPSGMTPKMEFLAQAKTQRRSWASNGHASQQEHASSMHGASPWLAPKRRSYAGARDSELYNLASTVQALLNKPDFDDDAAAVEAILGDEGLRRRANHRSINSVPNTPTFVPSVWTNDNDDNADVDASQRATHTPSVTFRDNAASDEADGRRSRMSLRRRPLSGMGAILSNMPGTRNRFHVDLPTTSEEGLNVSSSMPYLHLHTHTPSSTAENRLSSRRRRVSGVFTGHNGEEDGIIAYSGKALQNAKPSQALFFAGFLLMPWLWFIGGWGLDEEGRLFIEHEKGVGITSSQPYAAKKNADVHVDEDVSRSGWYDDDPSYNHSDGIHSSAQAHINHDDSPFVPQTGDEDGVEYEEDAKTQQRRRLHPSAQVKLWKRLSKAKTYGLRHARHGLGGEMQRKQASEEHTPPDQEWPMVRVARNAFDWRTLDKYVVANRVMAMIACIIVMGGMAVAIAAVVMHWR